MSPRHKLIGAIVGAVALLTMTAGVAIAASGIGGAGSALMTMSTATHYTTPYTGQGLDAAGLPDQTQPPNNGGTGQALLPGQPYLLWVLNGKGVTSPVVLHLPDGTTPPMINVGGTWKYVSGVYPKAQLLTVFATYYGAQANNLVISHGYVIVQQQSHITTTIHQGGLVNGAVVEGGALPAHVMLGAAVHDSAAVTVDGGAAIPANSTVTFKFTPGGATQTDPVDVATGKVDLALPKGPLAAGTYSYSATFHSGNPSLVADSSSAPEPLVIEKQPLSISTAIHDWMHTDITGTHQPLGNIVHDTATVTGQVPGFIPTGAITFAVNGSGLSADQTNPPEDDYSASTVDSLPLHAGSYSYTASIAGDSNYIGADNLSSPEQLTIDKGQLAIVTQIHGVNGADNPVGGGTHVALGSTVHDTATVSVAADNYAGFDIPGAGAVSFITSGTALSGAQDSDGETGFTAKTMESGPLHAGSYSYVAHVNGNSDYLAATSTVEPLTVEPAVVSIATVIHDADHGAVAIGSDAAMGIALHDTAVVTGDNMPFRVPVSFMLNGQSIEAANGVGDAIRSVEVNTAAAPLAAGHYVFAASVTGTDYVNVTSADEPIDIGLAWLSPGFWKTADDAAWQLTGVARTDLFLSTVFPTFYDTQTVRLIAGNPSLWTVLNYQGQGGANYYGPESGPYGLNPYNATAAYLTSKVPGWTYGGPNYPEPIDHHGNPINGGIIPPATP